MKTVQSLVVALICLCLLVSCKSTRVDAVWRDDTFYGQPKRVLVIGIAKDQYNKRLYETEFIKQLKPYGVKATPGYSLFTTTGMPEQAEIDAKIVEVDADAVLITRLVDKRGLEERASQYEDLVLPGYYNSWPTFFESSYRYTGQLHDKEVVVLETNIYDTTDQQLVWSALSTTFLVFEDEAVIRELVKVIIEQLSRHGLISANH